MKESTHPNGGSITENPSRQKSFVAFASSLRSELTDTEACCYRHVFTNSTMFKNHQNCLILQFYNRATTFAYSQLSKVIKNYLSSSKIIESHQKILRVIKSFKKFSLFEFSCLNLQLRITPQLL